MATPLPVSFALLQGLRRRGVRFVHWKSNHHLAEALAGETDLDLLVERDGEAGFRATMAEIGALPMQSQPWASYPGVEDWLVFDGAAGRFLHLHVHYELVTGLKRVKHLVLPWKEELLAGAWIDADSGWPIPSAEMELLNLLIRIWAKMPVLRRLAGPSIPPHIAEELRWLRGQAKPARLKELACRLGFMTDLGHLPQDDAAIIALARQLNTELSAHFRMPWRRALLKAVGLNIRLSLTRLWLRWFGPIAYRKSLPRGGLMIALVGSDGSGKSSLCRDIEKWLRFKIDVHLLYMGSGDGKAGWINGIRRAISARWGKAKAQPSAESAGAAKHSSFAARCYRLFDLILMRRKLRLLRTGRGLAASGSVILLDRYPQAEINAISDGPRQQDGRGFAWAARMERKLFEEAARLGPDLVIKLVIDPVTARARKPDHDLAVLIRKCSVVDGLSFPQSAMIVIDAARPYAEVLGTAKTAIWRHLAEPQA